MDIMRKILYLGYGDWARDSNHPVETISEMNQSCISCCKSKILTLSLIIESLFKSIDSKNRLESLVWIEILVLCLEDWQHWLIWLEHSRIPGLDSLEWCVVSAGNSLESGSIGWIQKQILTESNPKTKLNKYLSICNLHVVFTKITGANLLRKYEEQIRKNALKIQKNAEQYIPRFEYYKLHQRHSIWYILKGRLEFGLISAWNLETRRRRRAFMGVFFFNCSKLNFEFWIVEETA